MRWPVAPASLVIAAVAASATYAQGPPTTAHYAGALTGDPAATVELDVTRSGGRSQEAVFHLSDFTYYCENDPVAHHAPFPTLKAQFRTKRLFERRAYQAVGPNSTAAYLFKVQGELLGDGRSKGFVFYFVKPSDAPEAECSTAGLLRWKADRTP
jgi:hypothetical protein